jgi:excisionase family DNA binding protein
MKRPPPEPVAYKRTDVARITGLSERTIQRAIADGRLEARRFGARVIVRAEDLQKFLDNLDPARKSRRQNDPPAAS